MANTAEERPKQNLRGEGNPRALAGLLRSCFGCVRHAPPGSHQGLVTHVGAKLARGSRFWTVLVPNSPDRNYRRGEGWEP